MSLIRKLHESDTNFGTAIANLLTMAIFFCMRLFEYLAIPAQEERKTKLLTVSGFRFFSSTKEVPFNKTEEDVITVTITFVNQKNGEKQKSITLHDTKNNILCPVKASLKTV